MDALHRKFDKNAPMSNQLKIWDMSVKIIDKLLIIAKLANLPRVFYFYLKNTHSYIKLLLQHGMTAIESNLLRKADDVVTFLQVLQNSTRFSHGLCCQSKVLSIKFISFGHFDVFVYFIKMILTSRLLKIQL